MFTCKTCNKTFARKANLENHSMKIFPCKPVEKKSEIEENISENSCEFCKKIFSTKFNLNKHHKGHCKSKKETEQKKLDEITMMNKLKEMFLTNLQNTNITNNNITNNNITNNITNNIQLNIYSAGKEDLSRLSKEDVIRICTSGTYYPIVAAEVIHCNKNYPEFQNFLISNLRSNTGLVFLNEDWHSKSQEELLSNIMQVDKKHVSTLIKDLKVDDKLQVKLESTKQEIEENESKEHQKPKIRSKLYNASKMIKNNKKIIEKKLTDK
jgi:hypothetical protein